MNQPPRGHIECPAAGCQDGQYGPHPEPVRETTHGPFRTVTGQCRACNGLGYIPDPTLRRVVGFDAVAWRDGSVHVAALDDGSVMVSVHGGGWEIGTEGPLPGTLAHREAEDG